MKKILISIIIPLLVGIGVYQPTPVQKTPVSFSVSGITIHLTEHPQQGFLPYSEEFAFYRYNGNALDVASHCDTSVGSRFKEMQVGSDFKLFFNDGSVFNGIVFEILLVTYEDINNPYRANWILEGNPDQSLTVAEMTEYIMSKNAIVLHSSRCPQGFGIGQTFYIIPFSTN